MAAEGYDDRFILDRQHRRLRVFRPGGQIGDGGSLLPLGHGLLVDAVALGELPQALLTMLYRSTDRLCRRGAPVKNLSHSASFDSCDNGAPSKPGIKHLEFPMRRLACPSARCGDPCRHSETSNLRRRSASGPLAETHLSVRSCE